MSDDYRIDIDGQEIPVDEWPPWRRAVRLFLEAKFEFGAVIPHDWFWSAMAMERPNEATPMGTADKARLRFTDQFELFRRCLLAEHQMYLINERNIGYQLVLPKDQTKIAAEQMQADLRKAVGKGALALGNVRLDMLSDQERAQNADAIAKASMTAGFIRKTRMIARDK